MWTRSKLCGRELRRYGSASRRAVITDGRRKEGSVMERIMRIALLSLMGAAAFKVAYVTLCVDQEIVAPTVNLEGDPRRAEH